MDSRTVKGWFVVGFLCGHLDSFILRGPVESGDELICKTCRRSQPVLSCSAQFRIVCLGCRVRNRYGRAKLQAQLAMDAHMRKYPTHAMHLLEGNVILEVRSAKRLLQEIPKLFELDVDKPPF